jgi:acetylglutamate kinase
MSVRQAKAVRLVIEAMPYLRHFSGTTVVLKYGGAAMISDHLRDGFAYDIVLLTMLGIRPVIVHGGGPEITRFATRLGIPTTFIDGLRVTDAATMEIAEMVLVGKVNKQIVGLINTHGGTAVGLSGKDGHLIEAEPAIHVDAAGRPVDLGFVGQVKHVDTRVLELLSPYAIPVVASIGASATGQSYNINADVVTGELAAALGADRVIFLTDVAGIFDDSKPEEPWLRACDLSTIAALQARGVITGGMLPKAQAVRRALEGGVKWAHIIDGRVEHALLREILTDDPIGTTITA